MLEKTADLIAWFAILTALATMNIKLSDIKQALETKELDAYQSGFCGRCGRIRVVCERIIIETGKRCSEVKQ